MRLEGKESPIDSAGDRSAFLIIKGNLTCREVTCNVVINKVKPFNALDKVPQSKDWR